MRWLRRSRLLIIALVSFLVVAGGAIFKKSVALSLCGILSFNSPACNAHWSDSSRANAASPSGMNEIRQPTTDSSQEQKVARPCLFGVCAPVNLPKPIENIIQGGLDNAAKDKLRSLLANEIPISGSDHNFYPSVSVLPGKTFTPQTLDLTDLSPNTPIPAGDYEIPVHFYCTGIYSFNGRGNRFTLAQLKGRMADALSALYARTSYDSSASINDIQTLAWAMQSGMAYNELSAPHKALVDRYIPEYRDSMQRSFIDRLTGISNQVSRISGGRVPDITKILNTLGPVGDVAQSLLRAREQILQTNYSHQPLAQEFAPQKNFSLEGGVEKTPWSQVQENVYMRFIAPKGAMHDGTVQVRILNNGSRATDGSYQIAQAQPLLAAPASTGTITSETLLNHIVQSVGVSEGSGGQATQPAVSVDKEKVAQESTVKITNLRDEQLVALTDENLVTHQPEENENKPIEQRLIVEGTATKTKVVLVNGQKVEVISDKWKVELPITSLGKFTITAKGDEASVTSRLNLPDFQPKLVAASQLRNLSFYDSMAQANTNSHTINVHLFDVKIISPQNDWQVFPIQANPPSMPKIEAQAKIDGLSNSQIPQNLQWNWTLTVGGKQRQREGYLPYSFDFQGSTSGKSVWNPNFQEIIGGWGKFVVETQIDGKTVKSKPRWISIQGANPSRQEVKSYIDSKGGNDKEIIKKIVCHESKFKQFNPNPDQREGVDSRIPKDKQNSGFPLRPLFGAEPAGIGVAQLDPADIFPAQHWNWQKNMDEAIARYYQKTKEASKLAERERGRLQFERSQAVKFMKQKTGKSPENIPDFSVPDLTEAQLRSEKIRRYNGSRHHHFDANYVVEVDKDTKATPESGSNLRVDLKGTKTWQDNPAGGWESDSSFTIRLSVDVRREWRAIDQSRQNYVKQVESCIP